MEHLLNFAFLVDTQLVHGRLAALPEDRVHGFTPWFAKVGSGRPSSWEESRHGWKEKYAVST
jgi:hypothetical protein